MKLSPVQLKVAGSVGVIALLWWLARKAAPTGPGTVTSTLEIDANVESPTFGEPINSNPAVNPDMRRLIDVSNSLISADDAANPGDNQ